MNSDPGRIDLDLAEVVRDHRSRIYRYLLSMARDPDVAEDLTQETFLRGLRGLAPRTARALGLAIGERTGGPVFLTAGGRRLDRHGAGRIVRRVARRAGIGKPAGPHTLARIHHRRAGRRCPVAGRPGSRLTRAPPCAAATSG